MILFGNKSQVHAISDLSDIMQCVCESEFTQPCNISATVQIYPDGTKNINVELQAIKVFVYPYFYLMIAHFFTENMPIYNANSPDKPNQYSDDFELTPEMHLQFKLHDSLICLANTHIQTDGIACHANLEYQFKREMIKTIKLKLWNKVISLNAA